MSTLDRDSYDAMMDIYFYFDDRLANEHDGHNDYDAMLHYLFYFVWKLWLDLVWLIPILQPIRMIDIWNYIIVFKLGNPHVIND